MLAVKTMTLVTMASAVLAVAGCGGGEDSSGGESASTETAAIQTHGVKVPKGPPPTRLIVKDLKKGHGAEAKVGERLTVSYVGLRWNGEPFQTSQDNGKPESFTFELNNRPHEVSPGWERGVPGMKVGGRRELIIPPQLIYYPGQVTERDRPGPQDTLIYVIDLLEVN
jgi:peptidylprolyl isomerase